MKLQVCMTVMGAEYIEYGKISIPQFCTQNPDTELIVFCENKWPFDFPNLRCESFKTWYKPIPSIFEKTSNTYKNAIKLGDKFHVHHFVSHIFPMMQEFGYADYLLKIDVDEYIIGNMMKDVEDYIDKEKHDLYLVRRKHPLMKLYGHGSMPGVGFTLWRKDSKFVEMYVENFDQNEQDAILSLRNKIDYHEIPMQNWHIVYLEIKNPQITKEQVEEAFPSPKMIHCNSLNEMIKLKGWYNG